MPKGCQLMRHASLNWDDEGRSRSWEGPNCPIPIKQKRGAALQQLPLMRSQSSRKRTLFHAGVGEGVGSGVGVGVGVGACVGSGVAVACV